MSNLSENERKYVEDRRKALKEAVQHVDDTVTAFVEARADAILYKSIENGIAKLIEESIGDQDGHEPIKETIELTKIYWRDELRHVVRCRYEAERYLVECKEGIESALEDKEEAVKAFEAALDGTPEYSYRFIPEYPRGGNF